MQPRRVDASAAAVSSVTERYDRPAISRNEPIIRPPLLSSRSLFLSSSFSLFPRLRESIRSDAAAERGNLAAEGARDSGQEMSTRKSNSNLLVPCYRELARPRCNYLAILDASIVHPCATLIIASFASFSNTRKDSAFYFHFEQPLGKYLTR